MKTQTFFSFVLISVMFFTACTKEEIIPSDQVTARTFELQDFEELQINDPFTVFVNFSDSHQELRIEASDNLHSHIEVTQDNNRLRIKLEDHTQLKGMNAVLKVYLTTDKFSKIEAIGAANINLVNDWNTTNAKVEIAGASSLTGHIDCNHFDANLSGASKLKIAGKSSTCEINATGGSEMDTFDFQTEKLETKLNGASTVTITVNDQLEVDASGGSRVYYKGDGIVTKQKLSGGSEIIKQ